MIAAAVVVTRWLLFSVLLVLFGASLFLRRCLIGQRVGTTADRWPWRLLLGATSLALLSGVLWLMVETGSLSGEVADAVRWPVLWAVVTSTHFGLIGALRIGVLAWVLLGLFWHRARALKPTAAAPVVLGSLLVASFGWTGHGDMNEGWAGMLHLGADVLHLLAAGVWIGALVPLGVLVLRARDGREQSARVLHHALERFSGVGPAIVALLVATGLVNTWFLVGPGHWRELFTSGYGLVLCAKLALFALMLLLAAANRWRLDPALGAALGIGAVGDDTVPLRIAAPEAAALPMVLRRLRVSLLTETALALLVVAAVAWLGTLVPPVSG